MTEYLLILFIYSGYGHAIATVKVPDKESCVRAGKFFESKNDQANHYTCTQIKKEK